MILNKFEDQNSINLHPLLNYLKNPSLDLRSYSLKNWELFLHSARDADLLARISHFLKNDERSSIIPKKIKNHLDSAERFHYSQTRGIYWDIKTIHDVLAKENIPFIVLKGSAYILGELDAGKGRMVSDIDILVQKASIEKVEHMLIKDGWFPSNLNPYDQRYYREWMHEIPPLKNLKRGTTLDIHHTILPPTTGNNIDIDLLWKNSVPISDFSIAYRFSPADLIIHSAAHLFHNGEMDHGLRDLCDIASLINEFSVEPDFFENITRRAYELDLEEPLSLALLLCNELLNTPLPDKIKSRLESKFKLSTTATIFALAIISRIIEHPRIHHKFAELIVYVRSHYLRMPLFLLIPHLIRKSLTNQHN